MNRVVVAVVCVVAMFSLFTGLPGARAERGSEAHLNSGVRMYFEARSRELDSIPSDRKAQLDELAAYVRLAKAEGGVPRLTFVCTHNSRRSHLGQILSVAAAQYVGFPVESYSAGTEATAFNPRAVAAVERAGFVVAKTTSDTNPLYHVSMGDGTPVITCFSKKLDNAPNPTRGFAAVMVCTEADAACPAVPGAAARFALPYVDPKVSDGTPAESKTYDERCAQIAREMLYVMQQAAR